MDKEAVLKIVDDYREAVEKQGVNVSKVILFGSHARGDAREDSDIDLVVISDDFADMGYWDRIEVIGNALAEVWQPIEAVAMSGEEWARGGTLLYAYASQGEVVYSQ